MFTRARRYLKRVKSTRMYERWMYRLHPDMMIDYVEYLEARVKTLEAIADDRLDTIVQMSKTEFKLRQEVRSLKS